MTIAYVFDIDGSIVDPSLITRMFPAFVEQLALAGIKERDIQKTIAKLENRKDPSALSKMLNANNIYIKVLERYIRHSQTPKARQVAEAFIKIKKADKSLGLVSSQDIATVLAFLRKYDFEGKADFIEAGNKTKVLFWVRLEKKYGLSKQSTLVVSYNNAILDVAKHSGYKTINAEYLGGLDKFSY